MAFICDSTTVKVIRILCKVIIIIDLIKNMSKSKKETNYTNLLAVFDLVILLANKSF